MGTRAIGLFAGGFLVTIASGQTLPEYGYVFDIHSPTLMPGESTLVTLAATYHEPESVKVAGVGLDLFISTGSAGWSDAALIAPMAGPGTSPGTVASFGFENILAGQLVFPPTGWIEDPNPTLFWQATYTAPTDVGAPFTVEMTTETFAYHVYVRRHSGESIEVTDRVVEGGATIHIIPAPAAASLMALWLVGAARPSR